MQRRTFIVALTGAGVLLAAPSRSQTDPMPSWNEGPVKRAILDFVQRTTTAGAPDFVPAPERIACFDNDGTLWTEQPDYFQTMFAADQVKARASRHPDWKTLEPFKWVIEDNRDALAAMGEKGVLEIMAATHSDLTTEEFAQAVRDWLATARHPRFKRPYTDLVYQPMLELMALLRANQFKTFIVSGSGMEFMRPWTERVYGIPPEQVVGSSGVTRYLLQAPDRPVLMKEPKVEFIDNGRASPKASTDSSAGGRSSPSAIPTATSRCWNGRRPAPAHDSWAWSITPTPYGNTPTTAPRRSAASTRHGTRRSGASGPWST